MCVWGRSLGRTLRRSTGSNLDGSPDLGHDALKGELETLPPLHAAGAGLELGREVVLEDHVEPVGRAQLELEEVAVHL